MPMSRESSPCTCRAAASVAWNAAAQWQHAAQLRHTHSLTRANTTACPRASSHQASTECVSVGASVRSRTFAETLVHVQTYKSTSPSPKKLAGARCSKSADTRAHSPADPPAACVSHGTCSFDPQRPCADVDVLARAGARDCVTAMLRKLASDEAEQNRLRRVERRRLQRALMREHVAASASNVRDDVCWNFVKSE